TRKIPPRRTARVSTCSNGSTPGKPPLPSPTGYQPRPSSPDKRAGGGAAAGGLPGMLRNVQAGRSRRSEGGRSMGAGEYWNPKTESLGRDQLAALQLAKLRRLCDWAAARSPFYQRSFKQAGFEPDQLRSLDDLRRRPMLTREEWMASQGERPPFGLLPVAGRAAALSGAPHPGTPGPAPTRAPRGTQLSLAPHPGPARAGGLSGSWTRPRTGPGSPRCGATACGGSGSGR